MRTNKVGWVIVVLIIVLSGVWLFRSNKSADESGPSVSTELRKGEIKILGEIACLPYHITTAGQECVKGLKGSDGKIYALNVVTKLEEGIEVEAIGKFYPIDKSVDEASVFKYDGVLEVRTLKPNLD